MLYFNLKISCTKIGNTLDKVQQIYFLIQGKNPTPFTFTFSLLPLPPLHCLYVPSLLTNSPKQLNQELSGKNLTKLHMTMFNASSNTCSIKSLPSTFIFQLFESLPHHSSSQDLPHHTLMSKRIAP